MPNPNITYQGQTLVIPGVYYADNVSAVQASPSQTSQPLLFICESYGGVPQTPYSFFNPQQIYSFLRGSPAAQLVQFLYNGSNQLNGAQQVIVIGVNPSTQSSANIVSSGGTVLINMQSAQYGAPSNLLTYSVAAGNVTPGINLTLNDGYAQTSAQGQNLGVPFALAYTGTATGSVNYTVSGSAGVATNFIVSSPNTGESFNLPLGPSTYPNVQSIVSFLNGSGYYSAYAVSESTLTSTSLDITSAPVTLPPPTVASGLKTYTYENATAILGDVVYWLNTYSGMATGTVASGVVSSSSLVISPVTAQGFSGASNGTTSLSDYEQALNSTINTRVSVSFADTTALGVPNAGVANAVYSSQVAQGNPRRFVTGSNLGDTVTIAAQTARSYNALQATYVYPGIYANSVITGQNTLFSGLYTAACVAGMMAGNSPWIPLTNKSINATAMETTLQISDVNTLQQAGVMPVWISPITQVPTIISDLTTWQNDSNPENIFNQQVAERQALENAMIQGLQPYVGTPVAASPKVQGMVLNAAKRILNQNTYTDQSGGIISSWNPKTLTAVYTGATQSWYVSVDVVLVGQARFITVMANIQPLNLSLAA